MQQVLSAFTNVKEMKLFNINWKHIAYAYVYEVVSQDYSLKNNIAIKKYILILYFGGSAPSLYTRLMLMLCTDCSGSPNKILMSR